MANPPVVRLGSLTFNDVVDIDGDFFVVSNIDGWSEMSPELITVEKPVSDGAVVAYGRYGARPLTVAGYGIAPDGDGVWRVRSKLETATNIVAANANLEVDEPANTYRLVVRLAGRMRIRPLGAIAVEFEIPLLAVSPTKTVVP